MFSSPVVLWMFGWFRVCRFDIVVYVVLCRFPDALFSSAAGSTPPASELVKQGSMVPGGEEV